MTVPTASGSVSVSGDSFTSGAASSKSSIRNLPPCSQPMTSEAKALFRVWIATENGFPDNPTSNAKAKPIFIDLCKSMKKKEVLKRFKRDDIFANEIVSIIAPSHSQHRYELRSLANTLVPSHYKLTTLSETDIIITVPHLLAN
ncbi:hypothetical protein FRC02_002430, partial [Tulasnella sp. 418]